MASRNRSWHGLWERTDFGARLKRALGDHTADHLYRFIAEKYVSPLQLIMLGPGSTMALLARAMLERVEKWNQGHVTLVTPNLEVACEVMHRDLRSVDVIVPCGEVVRDLGMVKLLEKEGFGGLHRKAFSTVFVSFAGLTVEKGFSDDRHSDYQAKKSVLQVLDRHHKFEGKPAVFVLMRGTKLGVTKPEPAYAMEDLDEDRGTNRFYLAMDTPPDDREQFKEQVEALKREWELHELPAPDNIILLSTRP